VASQGKGDRSSSLLVEEYFDGEDSRFVDELRACHAPQRLAGLADRWKKDPRPWARLQILHYLSLPLDQPGHQPVVKRLFKHAESIQDDELMAAFLVAFDRLVRRVRRRRTRHNWQTRESWVEETLESPANGMRGATERDPRDPRTGARLTAPWRQRADSRLFTYHTRYYLRRRAWRYFRRLGFQRLNEYARAVARALERYQDEDFEAGENVLDSWGLMQICFRHHDSLEFQATAIVLKEGRSLGELTPAPRFPESWKQPAAIDILLELVAQAKSRLVRVWSMELLRRDHRQALADRTPESFLTLLDHEVEEVQQFGAELFSSARGLERLPIASWLRLLNTKSASALAVICDAMAKHVTGERLELAQCIELACARPTPVARMGLNFLKARIIATPEERHAISAVAGARCAAVGSELSAWALGHFGTPQTYDSPLVSRFFDSSLSSIRRAAWDWLVAGSPGFEDASLWSRLVETPYDDIRLPLVDLLQKRAKLPGRTSEDLVPVWSAVLHGVHRGGRQKAKAVRQVASAIVKDPAQANALLGVLSVAVRSVRAPEMRAGLAAIVGAVEARPELADAVTRLLPELQISSEGATR
jgi:hypothetical protein